MPDSSHGTKPLMLGFEEYCITMNPTVCAIEAAHASNTEPINNFLIAREFWVLDFMILKSAFPVMLVLNLSKLYNTVFVQVALGSHAVVWQLIVI